MVFKFYKNILIRTPVNNLYTDLSTIDISTDYLERLYLASPVFTKLILNKDKLKDFQNTLLKYHVRSIYRCTPFGLFAAVSLIKWGAISNVLFKGKVRKTRISNSFFSALIDSLVKDVDIRKELKYYSNSSLYRCNKKLKYAENVEQNFVLSEIENSRELEKILELASNGAMFSELYDLLRSEGYESKETTNFINSLIDNQVIVSEFESSVTGDEYIYQLVRVLEKANITGERKEILNILLKVEALLNDLDKNYINEISVYNSINCLLNKLVILHDVKSLFHVDTKKNTRHNSIDIGFSNSLLEGMEALFRLAPVKLQEPQIENFINHFYERYGDLEIPLTQVLDTETGISYPEFSKGNPTSILKDIEFADNSKSITIWDERDKKLFFLLQKSLLNQDYELKLTKNDIHNFENKEDKIPPSFSIIFRITDFKNNTVFIENAGGESAIKTLSRFAYLDKQISNMVFDISDEEENQNPEVIYAEIVHMPESQSGDIVKRPQIRKYEIPYLSRSSVDEKFQIPISDIFVSIDKNKIFLRSKRLNKRIIPCLSTAHNYALSELPTYRFLCDMQAPGCIRNFNFKWGSWTENIPFLPRVVYGKTILFLATWQLPASEWNFLFEIEYKERLKAVHNFRIKWNMPQYIIIAEGDKELFVDLKNKFTIDMFLDTIKNKTRIILKEYLFDRNTPIKDENGGPYVNQFIAPVLRTNSVFSGVFKNNIKSSAPTNSFSLGSEWIYFKLYCGKKTSDELLIYSLKSLVKKLVNEKLIDYWFYIRYEDPDFHLRLRFHLPDTKNLQTVIQHTKRSLLKFTKSDLVWRIATDSYKREIQRYGYKTINLFEKLFFYDSQTIVQFLSKIRDTIDDDNRWLWGIKSIDNLMNCFGYNIDQKKELMGQFTKEFTTEFPLKKPSKLQLDKNYRKHSPRMEKILFGHLDKEDPMHGYIKIIKSSEKCIRPLALEIISKTKNSATLQNYLKSAIHMHINRLLNNRHRQNERVLYDFMWRQYRSRIARGGK